MNKKTVGISFVVSVLVFALSVQTTFAFCVGIFLPAERTHTPPDHTRALIAHDGEEQTIVIEPLYNGDAKEFGMILPVPSKPSVDESPENVFEELEDLTNPFRAMPAPMMAFEDTAGEGSSSGGGVTVIEQKEVGDFRSTILKADDADALTDWLDDNDYEYGTKDEENFEYYIDKNGYYFIALKVTVKSVVIDKDGNINGRLSPLEIRFDAQKAIVPIRAVASNTSARMSFTLYTLADVPLFVPGVDIQYSQKLQTSQLASTPSLREYDGLKRWLVRHEIAFDPKRIEEDIVLKTGTDEIDVTAGSQMVQVNPSERPIRSGVLSSDAKRVVVLGQGIVDPEPTPLPAACLTFTRSLGNGTQGADVSNLQTYLKTTGHFTHPTITGYYGGVTERAVQSWQRSQGIVSSGSAFTTGFGRVGPKTQAALRGASCSGVINPINPNTKEIQRVQAEINELLRQVDTLRARLRTLQ